MADELSNAAHIFSELASRLHSSTLDSGTSNTPVHPVTENRSTTGININTNSSEYFKLPIYCKHFQKLQRINTFCLTKEQ
jgi:hypothetical protein